ncbi:hypothetical protein HanRHA438_Chr03g0147371 [Helianthus annuus]|nr:hypothetical protein HanRHA438_Chr03g0147371 [Helianthus annuus]
MRDLGMPSKALSDDKRHKTQELFHMPGDTTLFSQFLCEKIKKDCFEVYALVYGLLHVKVWYNLIQLVAWLCLLN